MSYLAGVVLRRVVIVSVRSLPASPFPPPFCRSCARRAAGRAHRVLLCGAGDSVWVRGSVALISKFWRIRKVDESMRRRYMLTRKPTEVPCHPSILRADRKEA